MPPVKLLSVKSSPKAGKRYVATFQMDSGRTKQVHFGDSQMENYTMHHDDGRRHNYLSRHRSSESWNTPDTAGSLSRWLLWEYPSLQTAVRAYRARFNL